VILLENSPLGGCDSPVAVSSLPTLSQNLAFVEGNKIDCPVIHQNDPD
jgi:hypothetical protein